MKQPIAGLKGIKPRLERPNGKLSQEEAHKLDREYRIHRNEALKLRNHRESMLLAKARSQLIEKNLVTLQAAYLLTTLRARVMAEPPTVARRLVDGGFVAEERRTEVQEMIKHDFYGMLRDLTNLPSQISDPDWIKTIDSDLRDQVEGDDGEHTAGRFVAHPSELRRRTEQAEQRREKKTETMRKLREEGRIKS